MVARGRGGSRGGPRGGLRATRGRGGSTSVAANNRQHQQGAVVKRGFKKTFVSRGGARGSYRGTTYNKAAFAGDARQRLISKHRSEISDARDKLAQLARGSDAREKIKRIQNIKQGKLEVKSTTNGAITITKTTRGTVELTTRRKQAKQKSKQSPGTSKKSSSTPAKKASGVVKRKHIGGERLRLNTVDQGTFIKPSKNASKIKKKEKESSQLTRTITGNMSDAAILDQELLSTHADPLVLKRTIEQGVEARRTRSANSPNRGQLRFPRGEYGEDVDFDNVRGAARMPVRRHYDYDDTREAMEREDEVYRRRIQRESSNGGYGRSRTMGDRFESEPPRQSSILQGSKIVVSNLHNTVTEEDIQELFGDVGPLRRAKMVDVGTAEVVFINSSDAYKAVEVYHNRQLDHKPMQCHFAGSAPEQAFESDARLRAHVPSRTDHLSSSSRVPTVEMGTVHRALFGQQQQRGQSDNRTRNERGRVRVALRM